MSSKRRFTEKEIAQIFEEATKAQNAADEHKGSMDGLTLEELKQIGSSTGIDPKYIARAVASLNKHPQHLPTKKHLGIPYGVARSIELPATFSDRDWEQLVVDLRRTFRATGKIKQDGSLREWSNGNLHALVEPTSDGYQLHIETRKGNMMGFLYGGVAYILMSLILMATLTADPGQNMTFAFLISGLFGVLGISAVATVGLTQPRWARNRVHQMEAICKRAVFLGREDDEEEISGKLESTDEKFLSLEDEEELNHQLRQFALRKKTSRA